MDKIKSYIHRATGQAALAVRVSLENYRQLYDFIPMTDDVVVVVGTETPKPLTIIINNDPASRKARVIVDGDYVFRFLRDQDTTLKNLHSLDPYRFEATFMPATVIAETHTETPAEAVAYNGPRRRQ